MSIIKLRRDRQCMHLYSYKTPFLYWTQSKRDYKGAFVRGYYKENRIIVSQNNKPLLFARSKTTQVKYTAAPH